jgi:hypothetical protein
MGSPSNLRPKSWCGCEAFQSPRPRRFGHDVAQDSIPIQHARASGTALRSSRSFVVLLRLFQPEHDVSSRRETDIPGQPDDVCSWGQTSRFRAATSESDQSRLRICNRYCGSQNRASHSNPQKRSIVLWYKVTERTVFVYWDQPKERLNSSFRARKFYVLLN